jgi:hypothetical protein
MTKKKQGVETPMNWFVLGIISIVLVFVATFCLGVAGDLMGHYRRVDAACLYIFAVALYIAGYVCFLFALKNFITEAHVKALEVFHGKKRAVADEANPAQE